MATDRKLVAVYIILGRAFAESVPYDAQGAFILLHSIARGLGRGGIRIICGADHLHVAAGMGAGERAREDARASMWQIIDMLEQSLTRNVAD